MPPLPLCVPLHPVCTAYCTVVRYIHCNCRWTASPPALVCLLLTAPPMYDRRRCMTAVFVLAASPVPRHRPPRPNSRATASSISRCIDSHDGQNPTRVPLLGSVYAPCSAFQFSVEPSRRRWEHRRRAMTTIAEQNDDSTEHGSQRLKRRSFSRVVGWNCTIHCMP